MARVPVPKILPRILPKRNPRLCPPPPGPRPPARCRRTRSTPSPCPAPFPLLQAAGSDALRTLLSLNVREPQLSSSSSSGHHAAAKPRLHLQGISAPTAGAVLRFLYTGKTRLDAANTLDVVLASERLGLSALRSLAERHLPRILRPDNACGILAAANA